MKSTVTWTDGMAFSTELDGFNFDVDAAEKFGGQGKGPKPKGLVLSALCGCTGMDVVSIMTKKRVDIGTFSVSATGTLADTHPKVLTDIELVYSFEGAEGAEKKLLRAIELSRKNYCAVHAMLAQVADIKAKVLYNGALILDETA